MCAVMAYRWDPGCDMSLWGGRSTCQTQPGAALSHGQALEPARPAVQTPLCPFLAREPSEPQFPHL